MRKIYRIAGITCIGLMLSSTININAQTVSNFENLSLPPYGYWDGSDMTGTHNAGVFTSTFNSGDGIFPNVYDTSFGAIYGYMSAGFAYSNMGNDSTSGEAFSSFAGGAAIGNNFCIGKSKSMIHLSGSTAGTTLTGMYVTNSTYAGISMRDGDFFGKVFGDSMSAAYYGPVNDGTNGEDWFLLKVIGYSGGVAISNAVEFYLADFRFANNSLDYIVDTWEWVDLSPLGNVDSVQFFLSSSDTTGGFGMNTPNFFAFDDFNEQESSIREINSGITVDIYPNPTSKLIRIKTDEHISNVDIVNIAGQLLFTATSDNIDVSSMQSGIYFIRIETAKGIAIRKFIKN